MRQSLFLLLPFGELSSVTTHAIVMCDTNYERSLLWSIESTTFIVTFRALVVGEANNWATTGRKLGGHGRGIRTSERGAM